MGDPVSRVVRGVDTVLRTSVASLYSNLVTRPTGRAVRVAIERQIQQSGASCLSILDFSQVGVIDYSCADEVIAKLLGKYRQPDRPADAFFLVQGVSEHQRDQIQAVLERNRLLLVALERDRPALWGPAPERLRRAWHCLDELGSAVPQEFASARGLSDSTAVSWLKRLVRWRVAVREGPERYASLSAALGRRRLEVLGNSLEGKYLSPSAPAARVDRVREDR